MDDYKTCTSVHDLQVLVTLVPPKKKSPYNGLISPFIKTIRLRMTCCSNSLLHFEFRMKIFSNLHVKKY